MQKALEYLALSKGIPVNVLVNLTAVNQMDPYDPDSSDGGSEFPLQSITQSNIFISYYTTLLVVPS